ncbi:MAG: hypothetical protein LT070_09055 [Solirubrobacteraceae bacterium]|nr:hypothetical protein [Solirubrobacteraceae bacterium]
MTLVVADILSIHPFRGDLEPGRDAAFLVLLAFLVSFAFIRTSARLMRMQVSWWPGSVKTSSGVHLHHLVWGIALMTLCGFLAFAVPSQAPWVQLLAIGFGVGAGLTFDEFALWVHLDDVYWAQEGRVSLDAVVLVTVFMALVVVGTRPFGLDEPVSIGGTALVAAQALALAVVSFLKGRLAVGLIALFLPLFGLVGALRLARPGSPWARRRYVGAHAERLARASARFGPGSRHERRRERLLNMIGGAPTEPRPPAEGG